MKPDSTKFAAGQRTAASSPMFDRLVGDRTRFLAFVRSRIEDDQIAQDLLQAAYLKLLTHAARLRDPARAEAWFFRVLRNLVADHYRAPRPEILGDEVLEALPAPASQSARLCPCLTRELDALPPHQAQALRTVNLEEKPVHQYATRAGISDANAFVRLHRARRALRERLEAVCQSCAGAGCLDCTCQ